MELNKSTYSAIYARYVRLKNPSIKTDGTYTIK